MLHCFYATLPLPTSLVYRHHFYQIQVPVETKDGVQPPAISQSPRPLCPSGLLCFITVVPEWRQKRPKLPFKKIQPLWMNESQCSYKAIFSSLFFTYLLRLAYRLSRYPLFPDTEWSAVIVKGLRGQELCRAPLAMMRYIDSLIQGAVMPRAHTVVVVCKSLLWNYLLLVPDDLSQGLWPRWCWARIECYSWVWPRNQQRNWVIFAPLVLFLVFLIYFRFIILYYFCFNSSFHLTKRF